MKKILLILAVVVCVAVAGSALAVAYYNASDISGTVSADKFVVLTLANSSDISEIGLVAGQSTIYRIQCDVTTSSTNEANGTLTVEIEPDATKNLTGVTVALYTDSGCTQAVVGKSISNAAGGSFTVTGIDSSRTYYAKVTFDGAANAEALANISGVMTISFEQAA